jgi:hypothetical protein
VPEDPLSQKESDFGFRPLLDLPRFRQIADKILEVSVVLDQTVENKTINVAGGGILGKNWIEIGGITDGTFHELVDFLGWTDADKNDIDPQKDKEKYGRNKEKGLGPQRAVLSNAIPVSIIIEKKSLFLNTHILRFAAARSIVSFCNLKPFSDHSSLMHLPSEFLYRVVTRT